jgi:phosphatidate cytidylyltransferase
MLKQRIITALLLGPIALAIIWYGNTLVFKLFASFLAFMITFEWVQIVKKDKVSSIVIAAIVAAFIYAFEFISFIEVDVIRLFWASAIIWFLCFIMLLNHAKMRYKYLSKLAIGVVVNILFGVSLVLLHQISVDGVFWTLMLFLLVWVADVGAYVSGKTFGKHKLALNISPGKTIEGMLGGMLLTAVFGWLLASYYDYNWLYFVIAFPIIAAISVLGDLFASLLKRHAQVKDSGHLLPGHGGFLDRFDALIAATPFYFGFINYTLSHL